MRSPAITKSCCRCLLRRFELFWIGHRGTEGTEKSEKQLDTEPNLNESAPVLNEPVDDAPNFLLEGGGSGEPVPAAPEPYAGVAEDLRVPWDGLDVLLYVFFGLGSAIVVARGLQWAFAVFFAIRADQVRNLATVNTAFAVTHQVLWSLVMLAFLWLQMELRFRAPFWQTLRFRLVRLGDMAAPASHIALLVGGAMTAIVVQIAAAFLRTPAKLPIEGMFQNRESILLMMAAGILVAPFVEEVMFRGFLYPVMARKFGRTAGILVVGALFGLMHAAQLWGGWGQIGLLVCVGIFFTYARAQTGSVLASYLLHLGYNGFLLLGFYFATGGLKNLPTPR